MRSVFLLLVIAATVFTDDDDVCPVSYTLIGRFCRKIFMHPISQLDAELQCQDEGAKLASIHDQEDNDAIMLAIQKFGDVFIGLNGDRLNKELFWLDESKLNYMNYAGDIDYSHAERGYIMLASSGQWAAPNQSAYPSICQMEVCGDDSRGWNYELVEELWYCIQPDPFDSLPWTYAENSCAADQATLVSVHEDEENSVLLDMIKYSGVLNDLFAIGLKTDNGTMTWLDGSPVDYVNFEQGFPSDSIGHCTALSTRFGGWITVDCYDTPAPFFCGKQPKYAVPPSKNSSSSVKEVVSRARRLN